MPVQSHTEPLIGVVIDARAFIRSLSFTFEECVFPDGKRAFAAVEWPRARREERECAKADDHSLARK